MFQSFVRSLFPPGGCRKISISFVYRTCNPKALRTTTSEVVLLLGQNKLGAHVVVVFWVVNSS